MTGNLLDSIDDVFGCKVGKIPSMYLGLHLCTGIPKWQLWDPVMERIERKLSLWK